MTRRGASAFPACDADRIETQRLVLRRWREADLEPFSAINRDPEVVRFLPHALSRDESDAFVARIEAHFAEHGYGLWAVERKCDGALLGAVGLLSVGFKVPFAPAVEVGWRLGSQYWGCGYATEAAQAAIDLGFRCLGLPEIVSFTVPANTRSQAVMRRLGMVRDPLGDFDHPRLEAASPLRRHVLYRLSRPR